MKALLVLLLASVCAGQSSAGIVIYCTGADAAKTDPACARPLIPIKQPKPLKCGKYEYVEWVPKNGNWFTNELNAKPPERPICAPIMHEFTEKEWQALIARVKALEKTQN